jgi:hypothetical protein
VVSSKKIKACLVPLVICLVAPFLVLFTKDH